MNKRDFLNALEARLGGLPPEDVERRLEFYAEMIDDRVEDGMSEAEAVRDLGDIDGIVSSIIAETPMTRLVGAKLKSKSELKGWHIALLVLGAPLWIPLLIALLAVIFAVFVTLFSLVIAAFSIVVSFAGTAIGCLAGGVSALFSGELARAAALIGAALVLAGLTVLCCIAAIAFSKWIFKLVKAFVLFIKTRFVGKEKANEQRY
ncbi:MAG: DUF1700 domain-containing protein [Clostridia bacterium]|nr:DUF1700 domain-containing protein [Clostridia bacterium]